MLTMTKLTLSTVFNYLSSKSIAWVGNRKLNKINIKFYKWL